MIKIPDDSATQFQLRFLDIYNPSRPRPDPPDPLYHTGNDLLIGRISFVNNGWRELKETQSSNWKIPCQTVIFGVSEKRLRG
ncbi:hypothetical protein T03_10624 [Trichinella britovi]|uniref:Uncharacterized protein n=1 Tax=Trichinella britovi TaxID=45882 RepID=A0A0V1C8Q7_TRIBR|nr:hypothetical protein T03_10624 [Trichinella britovi]